MAQEIRKYLPFLNIQKVHKVMELNQEVVAKFLECIDVVIKGVTVSVGIELNILSMARLPEE